MMINREILENKIGLPKLKVIEELQKLLPCDHLIVTGSTILKLYGFECDPVDLDIMIDNPHEEAYVNVERMEQESNPDLTPSGSNLFAMLTIDGIKVDVFQVFEQEFLDLGFIKISLPMDIFDAKKRIGRYKDYQQLKSISNSLLIDPEDTIDYISSTDISL